MAPVRISKRTVLGLSWLVLVCCLLFVVYSFYFALGAFYHPSSNGALYAQYYPKVALASVSIALLISLWNTLKRNRLSVRQMFYTLAIFVVSILAVLAILRVTNQQPEFYLRFVGDMPYAVQRVYGGSGARTPEENFELSAEYCYKTKLGKYASSCQKVDGVAHFMTTTLSSLPISTVFDVHYALDYAGVVYEGDVILFLPESDRITKFEADGMHGFRASSQNYFLYDDNNVIQLFARCRPQSKYCVIIVRTPNGILKFPSFGPREYDLERWRTDQAWHQSIFDGWRCEEPTCGGIFEEIKLLGQ